MKQHGKVEQHAKLGYPNMSPQILQLPLLRVKGVILIWGNLHMDAGSKNGLHAAGPGQVPALAQQLEFGVSCYRTFSSAGMLSLGFGV